MCVHACVHACVHLLTFSLKKTSPQKLLTGLLPNFIVVFLRKRLQSSLHCNRKIRPVERYRRSSTSSFISSEKSKNSLRGYVAFQGNTIKNTYFLNFMILSY